MKSQPSDTGRLAGTADVTDAINRELDALRQLRYRACEPDLDYCAVEFEKRCRSEIAAMIKAEQDRRR